MLDRTQIYSVVSYVLTQLADKSYILSVEQYLRLFNLLDRVGENITREKLSLWITPILAVSLDDQKQFHSWFNEALILFDDKKEEILQEKEPELGESEEGELEVKEEEMNVSEQEERARQEREREEGARQEREREEGARQEREREERVQQEREREEKVRQEREREERAQQEREQEEKARQESERKGNELQEMTQQVGTTYVAEIQAFDKPPYILNVELETEQEFTSAISLRHLANRLNDRQPIEARELDIPRMIQDLCTQPGSIQLYYRQLTQKPSYLLLIDKRAQRDHRAKIFNLLYEYLKFNTIDVNRFYFNADPRICINADFPLGIPLSQIQDLYGHARLLILAYGYDFFNPTNSEWAPWTQMFLEWQDRAILSPLPTQSWGVLERRLSERFVLLPATPQGVGLAVKEFQIEETKDSIEYLTQMNDAVTEPIYYQGDLIQTLNHYFPDPVLKRWIAACALYPTLHWELTLHIGALLKKEYDHPNLTSIENLLELVRLPWFIEGRIPDAARDELIQWLELLGDEKNIRRLLLESLNRLPTPPKDSVAYDEHQMLLVFNKWMLEEDVSIKANLEQEFSKFLELGKLPDFISFKKLEREVKRSDFQLPELWRKMILLEPDSLDEITEDEPSVNDEELTSSVIQSDIHPNQKTMFENRTFKMEIQRREYVLHQHTPILHFQYQEVGATLRPSELKPKLDRFLIASWTQSHDNEAKKRSEVMRTQGYTKYLASKKTSNEVPALDYSLSVLSSETSPDMKPIEGSYPMYFGNLGAQKKHLIYEKAVLLEVKSTNAELVEEIHQLLPNFLLWNNFGTRQSKGFGSYFLPTWDENRAGEKPRFYFDLVFDNEQDIHRLVFERIDLFYRTLRSGINRYGGGNRHLLYFKSLLWKYLKEQHGVQWDKKTVKQTLLSDVERREKSKWEEMLKLKVEAQDGPLFFNPTDTQGAPKALWRDVFGLSTEQSWKSVGDTLKTQHKDIARLRSPIHFKPLRTSARSFRVFFDVPPHIRASFKNGQGSAESEILGKTFELSFAKNRRSVNLPFTSSFDFDAFFEFAFQVNLKTHVAQGFQGNFDFITLEKIFTQLKSQVPS
jgi:hypothetical protein